MARYGVDDFSSFVDCKKSIVCLTLSEKRTGEPAWVVAFFLIPAGCWPEEFSCDSVEWTSRSGRLAIPRSPDFFRLLLSNCLNWKFTAMITLHFHLQPQYRYDLFHINFIV